MDDYLPLRKIALTCLETLLDESPEKLDLASLVQVIPLVLADKDELKTQAHQVLSNCFQPLVVYVLFVMYTLFISFVDPVQAERSLTDLSGRHRGAADRTLN